MKFKPETMEMSPLETRLQWAKVIGGVIAILLLTKIAFF